MTTTPKTQNTKLDVIKSLAWLIEATFRGFVGWYLLDHSHQYVVIAAAIYSLLGAAIIVGTHFVKAHKA